MFTAALFTVSRTWKQPRCLLIDEWIKKLWYIYTMEYYSAIKRNTFESVLMRWMNLEPIILREVSQKEKDKYCILTHISEKAMAPRFSTLAWKIPWTEEPGRLQSMITQENNIFLLKGMFFLKLKECSNYHTIVLISHNIKVMLNIL